MFMCFIYMYNITNTFCMKISVFFIFYVSLNNQIKTEIILEC